MSIQEHTQTTYTNVKDATPESQKGDYRVFVEILTDGVRSEIIVAYKGTQLAAERLSNKIGREHAYGAIASWGWELKDKYNSTGW